MHQEVQSSRLKVPGATIYHEARGEGPLLLIIPGGPQDAGVFAGLAHLLADRYKVVAYDPRGNSRSTFDGEPTGLDVDMQADDAARLIEELGAGPAHVFGTSGGAQIGLSLAARHPERVAVLVAHEPPAITMLDDPSAELAAAKEIQDVYRSHGVEAAMARFFAMNGLEGEPDHEEGPPEFEPSPEDAETFARVSENFDYWLAHGMMPLSLYRPDVEALRKGRPRVIVGIGEQSEGQPIYDMGLAVSKGLGSEPQMFPGDHMGFELHAELFAETLHQAFSAGDLKESDARRAGNA